MNKLDRLREDYKKASSQDERDAITKQAKLLKGELYQCYFVSENKRCENHQDDYWCSEEHKRAWRAANYGDKRPRGIRRLTIQQMQDRLKEMAVNAAKKKHTKTQSLSDSSHVEVLDDPQDAPTNKPLKPKLI